MYIELQQGSKATDLSLRAYALAFVGVPLDERGRQAVGEVERRSSSNHTLEYDGNSMSLTIDGQPCNQLELKQLMGSACGHPICLETTTLGFVEVLLCCRAAFGVASVLECIYVEPGDYRRSIDSHLLAERDFELSGEVVGFRGIPGVTRMLNDRRIQRCVFFLGYEGARFRRAFTDLEMLRGNTSRVVFGIPAFRAGWEMDSLANNLSVMQDERVASVSFCGADNPRAAIDLLKSAYAALQLNEALFIAPIGTKLHGLATALFVAEHRSVGVIYDHPNRSPDRSTAVGNWHRFIVTAYQ